MDTYLIITLIVIIWLLLGFITVYLDHKINNVNYKVYECVFTTLFGLIMFIALIIDLGSGFWNRNVFK